MSEAPEKIGFKDFLTAREPGCGYFQGAEGALRFVVCACVVAMLAAIYFLVERLL